MTRAAGLGTFGGVFTPSILTILGIILFLRLGYVVGETGLAQALVVIALANAISVLTSLSVAAISTNIRVKGGGDYYLISRTLGVGFGGAIGLVLFFAQSISIGFYCMGFGEVVAALGGLDDAVAAQWIAALAVVGLFVLAWFGTDWATRFQYAVMAAILAAVVSFAWGASSHWDRTVFDAGWTKPDGGLPFWAAFAIFFPAVTGFTQGVSMSGDLKDASHSIPRGVLTAVGVSILVYFGVAVLLAGSQPAETLRSDYFALKRDMVWSPLFDAGVIAATLSSALASFLGAPRILQSLAEDEVFPLLRSFAHGSGTLNNPRRAVVFAGATALAVIAIGNLNLVASIVSMFFLISYGLLNYATYFEARASSPSFRPTFRFYHANVGFAGALACLGAMLAIDLRAGVAAAAIVFGIYHYLRLSGPPARWADSRRSHHLQQAREHLLAAAAETEHPRDWRPQLLVFSDAPERRRQLLRFARWIEGGCGLTSVVRVLVGEGTEALERRSEAFAALQAEIRDGGFEMFPLVVAGKDLEDTIASVIQSSGIGPLRSNTVIANWVTAHDGRSLTLATQRFSRNLRTAFRLGCNLLVLDAAAVEWQTLDSGPGSARRIDIWWRQNKTGELMLLLGHLVMRADSWQGSRLRVFAEPADGETEQQLQARLSETFEDYRIEAEVVVCAIEADEIVSRSADSSLVFLPFSVQAGVLYGPAGGDLIAYLDRLPIVVLTLAAQDVDLDADPDVARADHLDIPAA